MQLNTLGRRARINSYQLVGRRELHSDARSRPGRPCVPFLTDDIISGTSPRYPLLHAGSVNPNELSWPIELLTRTSPASLSTIRLTMDRPSPWPSALPGVTRENS